MTSTKIDFRYRRIYELDDLTDLVEMLFPGNRNQQHAASRILLALKAQNGQPVASFAALEHEYDISRRTLQRTRAKLARLGLIERLGRPGQTGCVGWRLSGRMGTALRRLAETIDCWRSDRRVVRRRKDEQLVELLR
ncbi:MAG: hypothetical protein ACOC93_00075 [Planctomycetota bacterium]